MKLQGIAKTLVVSHAPLQHNRNARGPYLTGVLVFSILQQACVAYASAADCCTGHSPEYASGGIVRVRCQSEDWRSNTNSVRGGDHVSRLGHWLVVRSVYQKWLDIFLKNEKCCLLVGSQVILKMSSFM